MPHFATRAQLRALGRRLNQSPLCPPEEALVEIGRHITHAAESARSRTAPREALMGSTFTISNVGSHAALACHERKLRVVAVSDVRGAIENPAGFDIPALIKHVEATKSEIRRMLEAGADRIGTSASLKILNEWRASLVAVR